MHPRERELRIAEINRMLEKPLIDPVICEHYRFIGELKRRHEEREHRKLSLLFGIWIFLVFITYVL